MECHNFTPQMQTFIDFATYGPMIQDPLRGKKGVTCVGKAKMSILMAITMLCWLQ